MNTEVRYWHSSYFVLIVSGLAILHQKTACALFAIQNWIHLLVSAYIFHKFLCSERY